MNPLPLGRIVATPGALRELERAGTSPALLLARHACGDWGELDAHDRAANQHALEDGGRVLSAYNLPTGTRIWIITESEDDTGVRQSTCILLPSEY